MVEIEGCNPNAHLKSMAVFMLLTLRISILEASPTFSDVPNLDMFSCFPQFIPLIHACFCPDSCFVKLNLHCCCSHPMRSDTGPFLQPATIPIYTTTHRFSHVPSFSISEIPPKNRSKKRSKRCKRLEAAKQQRQRRAHQRAQRLDFGVDL